MVLNVCPWTEKGRDNARLTILPSSREDPGQVPSRTGFFIGNVLVVGRIEVERASAVRGTEAFDGGAFMAGT